MSSGRGVRPRACGFLRPTLPGGGAACERAGADREPETRKTASGVTPGGLRIRLLMKETVRGPLRESLLLRIDARIERRRRKERGREHAGAGLCSRTTAENGERGTEEVGGRAISRMPRPTGASPTERLTEHGQTRMRLRFHQGALKGEDHGTVTARLFGARSPIGRGCLLRRSRPERHSTCSPGSGVLQVFNSLRRSNEGVAVNDIKRDSFVPHASALPNRAQRRRAGPGFALAGAGASSSMLA